MGWIDPARRCERYLRDPCFKPKRPDLIANVLAKTSLSTGELPDTDGQVTVID